MPEIMGATNPVPGYDNSNINRNLPMSPDSTQVQNVPDPTKVVRADGKTERQDNGLFGGENIRYDSNFQSFIQRLRESPGLVTEMMRLFTGKESTVVFSGMSGGIAEEISKAMQMMHMDESQLLEFVTTQMQSGSKFGGALMSVLRSAYARAASDGVRQDILQFLKSYSDYSSTEHIEGNMVRNMQGMADAMPASWAERLRDLTTQLETGIAAGDRRGNIQLLKQEVIPHMSSYVSKTHDLGLPRQILSLLTLDLSRYENGDEDNMLELFHRLVSYGTMKTQLGGVSDEALLAFLKQSKPEKTAPANQFAEHLSSAAARALRGEGDAETQQVFQQIVGSMLVNESVYMPVNHYIIPLEWEGKYLFSEMWVDPDAEDENGRTKQTGGRGIVKVLFKLDVQGLGFFDVLLTTSGETANINVACPDMVLPFSKEIEKSMSEILSRNGLKPAGISVQRLERPVTLTEVFPQIFEGKNSVNVKI